MNAGELRSLLAGLPDGAEVAVEACFPALGGWPVRSFALAWSFEPEGMGSLVLSMDVWPSDLELAPGAQGR